MENSLFIPRYDNEGCLPTDSKESVMQDWTKKLYFKQQTSLISAIRGCDIPSSTQDEKDVVKVIRGLVLRDADGRSNFMSHYPMDVNKVLRTLVTASQDYNKWHWLNHVVSAFYSISLYHHNEYTKLYYLNLMKAYAMVVDKEIAKQGDKITNSYICSGYFTRSNLEDEVVMALLFTKTNYPHKLAKISKALRGLDLENEDNYTKIPELVKDCYDKGILDSMVILDILRRVELEDIILECPEIHSDVPRVLQLEREFTLRHLPIEFNSNVSKKEREHILHIIGVQLVDNIYKEKEEDKCTTSE